MSSVPNIVYLNGQYLPIEEATISVMDRGFLYGDGVSVVEWAEKLKVLLPEEYMKVKLTHPQKESTERFLEFSSVGRRYNDVIKSLKG